MRTAYITPWRPYLLLPAAIWVVTAGLGVAIAVRAVVFGWSSFLVDLAFVGVVAGVGSAWIGAVVGILRFDFALDLNSPRSDDGKTALPTVRSVLERELGIVEEREFRRWERIERFHGLWPGLGILPHRVGFQCRRGLAFMFQSLTEPDHGAEVRMTVLARVRPGGSLDEAQRVLRQIRQAWLASDAVPIRELDASARPLSR